MVVTIYSITGSSVWGWIGGQNRQFKKGDRYAILSDRERTMKILGRCSLSSYSVPQEQQTVVMSVLPVNAWKKITQIEFDRILGMCKTDAPPVVSAPAPSVVANEKLQKPSEILAKLEPPKEEVIEPIVEVIKEEIKPIEEPKNPTEILANIEPTVEVIKEEIKPIEEPKVEEVKEVEPVEEKVKAKEKTDEKVETTLGALEKSVKKFRKKNGKK